MREIHTSTRPKDHNGVVLDELYLADFSLLETDGHDGTISGGADTVGRVQDHLVDIDWFIVSIDGAHVAGLTYMYVLI